MKPFWVTIILSGFLGLTFDLLIRTITSRTITWRGKGRTDMEHVADGSNQLLVNGYSITTTGGSSAKVSF